MLPTESKTIKIAEYIFNRKFMTFYKPTQNKLRLIQLGYIVLSFDKFSGNTSGTRTCISSFPQNGQNMPATLFSSMMYSDLNVISKEFAPGNEQL